jgi:hypothetical protein
VHFPRNRLLVTLLFISAAIAGSMPQEKDSRAGVSGTVTNAATGAPIPRAHVQLYLGGRSYGALTDINGRFAISQLPGGESSISIEAPGFQSPSIFSGSAVNRLVLGPDEQRKDLNIALTRFGAISGCVFDANGRPLQGIAMSVLSIEGVTEGEVSDPDGQYRIGNLPPGRYRVQADPALTAVKLPPEIRTDGTAEIHYAPTYYSSSLTTESASRVDVLPGAEVTGIDIRLVRTPIIAVRGTVTGIPAAGIKEVYIYANKVEPPLVQGKSVRRMFSISSRANPDGTFALWRLDPGSYILTARSYPEGWGSPPAVITVGGKDIDGIAVHLIQLFDISGLIIADDSRALLPRISFGAGLNEIPQISLQGITTRTMLFSEVAADRSFHITRIQPDQYSVHLTWNAYVKSMRLGSTNIEGPDLDPRSDSKGGALTATVSSAVGQISGVVRNAAGAVPYARVALLSEAGGIWDNPSVLSSRSDGTYAFANLTPGKYKLITLDRGVANARALRYHLDDYADVLESVEIHSGERLIRNLRQH